MIYPSSLYPPLALYSVLGTADALILSVGVVKIYAKDDWNVGHVI